MKQNWEKELLALLKEKRIVEYSIKIVKRAKQEERERIKQNIGQLRQWLNERTEDRLITNEDIETFLNN